MPGAPKIHDLSCGDGTNTRDYFSPPGGPVEVLFDGTPSGPDTSFLADAHPGPAPACPEEVVESQPTPVESLANEIIVSAREVGILAAPLTERIRLRESTDLSGIVSEVEVQTATGYLSLGGDLRSAFVQMLAVAEAIVLRLGEEKVDAQRNALAHAEEHVREIRAALDLPKFEVGQVWRLVDTREIT
jgi:hypothetical protein